jgi:hypothetical protein
MVSLVIPRREFREDVRERRGHPPAWQRTVGAGTAAMGGELGSDCVVSAMQMRAICACGKTGQCRMGASP